MHFKKRFPFSESSKLLRKLSLEAPLPKPLVNGAIDLSDPVVASQSLELVCYQLNLKGKIMTHIFDVKNAALASAFVGALLLGPALAASEPAVGDVLGSDEATIRTSLEAQGYVVDEFENEDGEIEVEVAMNDKEMEIKIDAETGAVLEIESDDDDDTEDDD